MGRTRPSERSRITQDDCVFCGACCVNPPENAREGYIYYVPVSPRDGILADPALASRFVTYDDAGTPHLRLVEDGRCKALRGAIGKKVGCTIYPIRPTACRRVEAGSELCLRYRSAHRERLERL